LIRSFVAATLVAVALLASPTGAEAARDEFFQVAGLTNASGAAGDYAGGSVAISADGSTIVVGAPGASSNQGVAYVYTRGANGWQTANQPTVLAAHNGAGGDEFGHSVAVSQDGSVIVVGAPYASAGGSQRGTVYVYNRPAGGWQDTLSPYETTSAAGPADYDRLGFSVAVSPDGTYVAAGETGYSSSGPLTGQGGVYVWSYNGSALSAAGSGLLTASDAGNEDSLGWSLAMPSDGLIYAGAAYHPGNDGPGAVYGFSSESSIEVGYGPWDHVSQTELSASGSSLFGVSVAAGGGIVAAGAPDTDSNQGAVYLFEPALGCATQLVHGCFRSSTDTTPTATLTYPSGNGQLGYSVALSGDGSALLTGAPGEPVPPNAPPGDAYAFQAPSGGWANAATPDRTLGPDNSTANDLFGASVAMSADGAALAVGAPGGAGDDQMPPGEAEVFEAYTSVAPSCEPATVSVGQATTCTATVTDDGIGEATPTGTVGFTTDSSGSFGGDTSCTLSEVSTGTSSCQVTYTPSAAGSGSHLLTASYSGDDAHAPGIAQEAVAINRVTTSTSVSCSPASVAIGQGTSCVATVTGANASAGPPTGAVSFTTNGPGAFSATGCQLAGSGATASCAFGYTPSAIGPGTHQLTAAYGGDGGHAASLGSDPLGVGDAPTSASIGCSPLSVAVGKATTCTITVTDAASGGPAPTGTVKLASTGAGNFSACTLAGQSTGAATCQVTYRPANAAASSPQLTATYGGDGDHFGSSASALLNVPATGTPTITVGKASVKRGRIVLKLTCPRTEAYCRVAVAITVRGRLLASSSIKILGGATKTVTLTPASGVVRALRTGGHATTITLVAVDQSGRRKRRSLTATLITGSHFDVVRLVVRK
jgi:hypothetical protein